MMKIVNKKRFIIVVSFLLIAVISLFGFVGSKVFSYTTPEYHLLVVSEGDTLWSIAAKGSGNINETIYQIKQVNSLTSSCIYVGQELLVPFVY